MAALSSLGFRFDGLGGWADERVPIAARPLDGPRLCRAWTRCASATGRPRPRCATLFADVTVAADEHLAGAAGDLTLGELVAMLGRRADGLAMLWNDWGRVRPLLLEDA